MDVKNYAAGICKNNEGNPVCLLLSCDSLDKGADIAINAKRSRIIGDDLYLSSDNAVLVLKNLNPECLNQLKNGLPIVIIDPARGLEIMIKN